MADRDFWPSWAGACSGRLCLGLSHGAADRQCRGDRAGQSRGLACGPACRGCAECAWHGGDAAGDGTGDPVYPRDRHAGNRLAAASACHESAAGGHAAQALQHCGAMLRDAVPSGGGAGRKDAASLLSGDGVSEGGCGACQYALPVRRSGGRGGGRLASAASWHHAGTGPDRMYPDPGDPDLSGAWLCAGQPDGFGRYSGGGGLCRWSGQRLFPVLPVWPVHATA
ncbi:Hypothetical protein GbCGDNIH6_2118 [Granulibacter bethesdensis]|nr:Hypothetical protein GbCGDNIH6_2118 [Granulibacter bethesdensis]